MVVRYSVGIINWKKDELQNLDGKTRRILPMYRAFHRKSDVDRLYVTRSWGGRGLSVEDCVSVDVCNL